jgi:hypothetical protein
MRDKTLESIISRLKDLLKFDDLQLATFLNIEVQTLEKSKHLPTFFAHQKNLSEQEKQLEDYISSVYFNVREFKSHHMTNQDIDEVMNSIISHESLAKPLSLKELCAIQDYELKYSVTKPFIEKTCLKYFTEYEIGSKAPEHKNLNKRIAEEFFNHKVKINEKWIYSETGDYTILEPQEELEVYSDGSGSHWEKLREFSTDISQAWILVEELAKKRVQVRLSNKAQGNDYWWCYISDIEKSGDSVAQGSSAPEAICLAVLDYLKK